MSTFAYRSRNVTMTGTIFDSRLDDMAADWASKKAREIEKVAKANVVATGAVRTGALLHGIHATRRKQAAGYTTVRVISRANHSAWVHEGTYGPITAKHGPAMWVPKAKRSRPGAQRVWMTAVRGQKANPFLSDAMYEVLVATQLKLF
jgi:hypothetical protein